MSNIWLWRIKNLILDLNEFSPIDSQTVFWWIQWEPALGNSMLNIRRFVIKQWISDSILLIDKTNIIHDECIIGLCTASKKSMIV